MANYYFTFGSHPAYPYGRNEFVQVVAGSMSEAAAIYRRHHPNREGSRLLNCADLYDEETFNKFRNEFYLDKPPVEVLTVDG